MLRKTRIRNKRSVKEGNRLVGNSRTKRIFREGWDETSIRIKPSKFDRETLIDLIDSYTPSIGERYRGYFEDLEHQFDNNEIENPLVEINHIEEVQFNLIYNLETGEGTISVRN